MVSRYNHVQSFQFGVHPNQPGAANHHGPHQVIPISMIGGHHGQQVPPPQSLQTTVVGLANQMQSQNNPMKQMTHPTDYHTAMQHNLAAQVAQGTPPPNSHAHVAAQQSGPIQSSQQQPKNINQLNLTTNQVPHPSQFRIVQARKSFKHNTNGGFFLLTQSYCYPFLIHVCCESVSNYYFPIFFIPGTEHYHSNPQQPTSIGYAAVAAGNHHVQNRGMLSSQTQQQQEANKQTQHMVYQTAPRQTTPTAQMQYRPQANQQNRQPQQPRQQQAVQQTTAQAPPQQSVTQVYLPQYSAGYPTANSFTPGQLYYNAGYAPVPLRAPYIAPAAYYTTAAPSTYNIAPRVNGPVTTGVPAPPQLAAQQSLITSQPTVPQQHTTNAKSRPRPRTNAIAIINPDSGKSIFESNDEQKSTETVSILFRFILHFKFYH